MELNWPRELAVPEPVEMPLTATESTQPKLLLTQRYVSFLLAGFGVYWGIEFTTHFYLLFLTHWGCLITGSYYASVLAAYRYPKVERLAYVLYQTALVLEAFISLAFWTTVYPFVDDLHVSFLYTLSVHGGLLLLLLLEYPFNRIRFHLKHLWVCVGVLAVYLVLYISVAFTIRPIYPMLTFRDLGSVVLVVGSVVVVYLLHRLVMKVDECKYRENPATQKFELIQY